MLSNAQRPGYNADVDKLYTLLQKTPSYKAQIRGDKQTQYKQLYNHIKTDLPNAKTDFDRFYLLAQLLLPIKDNHLYFYQAIEKDITNAMLMDSAFIRSYRGSAAFKDYPRVNIRLDSLEDALKSKSKDSVEGIYYYTRALKVGLYRTAKKDSLVGVVLQSNIHNWDKGQIAFILREDRPNHFIAYHGHILNKTFNQLRNEKLMHASLTESGWKKDIGGADYINIAWGTAIFQLKSLTPNVQYLRLGSFASSDKSIAAAQEFYLRIKDSLTAPNLIVDLRNNGGGGFKTSQRFFDLLKKYSNKGTIYALINNRSVSNTEQFTLKLKELKNITLLGETTNGMITYGSNYGITETLPGGHFKLYITDMKESGNYLPYEGIGVAPDVFLKTDSDWVAQVLGMIK